MNAQNAQALGYEDGKRFIRGYMEDKPFTEAHKTIVLAASRNRAIHIYRVKSATTTERYMRGTHEAWESCVQEQAREKREAEARAAIPHNPSSRFCMCVECSKGE